MCSSILDKTENDIGLVYSKGIAKIYRKIKEPSFWWECEHCGKLIPYMATFCNECTKKLLGDPPEREDTNGSQ